MSSQRTAVRRPPAGRRPPPGRRRRRGPHPIVVLVGLVFALAAVAAILSITGDEAVRQEVARVEVVGSSLPPLRAGSADTAVGMKVPEVRGVNFDGNPISIVDDGRAKAIVLLAHWCPHCQREVSSVAPWLERSGGVEGVDVYAVSTLANTRQPNWPPSAWLEREHWPTPVVVDDAENSVADSFGLVGTPMWVFVRPDGTVARRVSGAMGVEVLQAQMAALKSS